MPIRFRSALPMPRGEVVVGFDLVFVVGTSISVQSTIWGYLQFYIIYCIPPCFNIHDLPCSSTEAHYAPESDIARKWVMGGYINLECMPKNSCMAKQ